MSTSQDCERWGKITERAKGICESARHDPYEPQLVDAMQLMAAELAGLIAGEAPGSADLDNDELEMRSAAHAAAGEAWFALNDSKQALAQFDTALGVLGTEWRRSPASAAVAAGAAAQALCGRSKCLVDLQHSAEAIAALDTTISWCTTQGDPKDDAQQSLLSQALHTLGLAYADAGDHERALEATSRAVELRRRLAQQEPDRHRLALSRSLNNLGNWLNELGRSDEAQQSRREMLELRREQWRHEPSTVATVALAQALDIFLSNYGE